MLRNRFYVASFIFLLAMAFLPVAASRSGTQPPASPSYKFPYEAAGLNTRQAAAHLLNRFAFGATPAEIDKVVNLGLEEWFDRQLHGAFPEDTLTVLLKPLDGLRLSTKEIQERYPRPIDVLKKAREAGVIPKDSATDDERKVYKKELAAYVKQQNFRRQPELFRQMVNAKIIRAIYSNNQLNEVMTDFWFNHFNVSLTKRDCALFVPGYERDAIRPNVTGSFEKLLLATAKSPAMLMYLDNFSSVGQTEVARPGGDLRIQRRLEQMKKDNDTEGMEKLAKQQARRKAQGLNENYAREVMELHTLGVDGGYTQEDVTNAARILTGWTVYPMENGFGAPLRRTLDKIGEDKLAANGFVHEGDFLFAANRHDRESKQVLGKSFSAGGGYSEGVELLRLLAHHPSTAKFISKKLAVRFVNDDPSPKLVGRMAAAFSESKGDISSVLIAMVSSPEFWNKDAVRVKTKSPFELVVSAVRMLGAEVEQPYQLFNWMEKMGQRIYYYQAPTGFPDRAQYWINTGALLNRMNFGIAITSGNVRGVNVNLLGLNNDHEPESAAAALVDYCRLLLPERDPDPTIRRLTPLLTQPALEKKIAIEAGKKTQLSPNTMGIDEAMEDDFPGLGSEQHPQERDSLKKAKENKYMLAQVVGIIIGSPEFQRK